LRIARPKAGLSFGKETAPARGYGAGVAISTADTRGVSHSAATTKFSRVKVPPYFYGENVPHAVQTLVSIRDLIFSIQKGGNTHFSGANYAFRRGENTPKLPGTFAGLFVSE